MNIVKQMSSGSRAEYLLFLWQTEDTLRAFDCDFEQLAQKYLSAFTYENEEERKENETWYEQLCEMMHNEGATQNGHVSLSRIVLQDLEELHTALVQSPNFPYYREMYYKALPYIVEIRTRGVNQEKSELELCFDTLYGLMMLRLQKKPISEGTTAAAAAIASLLGQLSDYYAKNKIKPIEL